MSVCLFGCSVGWCWFACVLGWLVVRSSVCSCGYLFVYLLGRFGVLFACLFVCVIVLCLLVCSLFG